MWIEKHFLVSHTVESETKIIFWAFCTLAGSNERDTSHANVELEKPYYHVENT